MQLSITTDEGQHPKVLDNWTSIPASRFQLFRKEQGMGPLGPCGAPRGWGKGGWGAWGILLFSLRSNCGLQHWTLLITMKRQRQQTWDAMCLTFRGNDALSARSTITPWAAGQLCMTELCGMESLKSSFVRTTALSDFFSCKHESLLSFWPGEFPFSTFPTFPNQNDILLAQFQVYMSSSIVQPLQPPGS